jgi:hypothetical protein
MSLTFHDNDHKYLYVLVWLKYTFSVLKFDKKRHSIKNIFVLNCHTCTPLRKLIRFVELMECRRCVYS